MGKEVKIGLLVLVGIVAFILGTNYLSGNGILGSKESFYAVYPNSGGLLVSNPVTINNVQVGIVREVELNKTNFNSVIVKFSVNENGVRIPKGSAARIISADILGSKQLALEFSNSAEFHVNNDTLVSEMEKDLQERVTDQIAPLKIKSEELLSSLDSMVLVVRSILDENTRENIAESFQSLNASFRNFERTSRQLDDLVSSEKGNLSKIIKNVEEISTNWADNGELISNIVSNFSSLSDSLAAANIASTITELNEAMSDVNLITEGINKGEGSIGKLIKDDELYNRLSSASNQLDALLEDVRLHPERYAHFSIFGRKERTLKMTRKEILQLQEHLMMGGDSL
ncbi:MAG: MlaD family protein [Bacteroidota bacterium]